MSEESGIDFSPPYVGYKTFKGFLSTLKTTGIPPQIDSSVMPGKSSGTKASLRVAFQFFKLIDDSKAVTDRLERVVAALDTDEWQSVWREIVREAYGPVIEAVPLERGTAEQLADAFRERAEFSGSTLRKAIRFFLTALEDAGIEHSPHFRAPKSKRSRKRTKKAKAKRTDKKAPKKTTEKEEKSNDGAGFDENGEGMRVHTFHIPTRDEPIKIKAPDDLSSAEWDLVSGFMEGFINLRGD